MRLFLFFETAEGRIPSAAVTNSTIEKSLQGLFKRARALKHEGITTLNGLRLRGSGVVPLQCSGFIEDDQIWKHVVHVSMSFRDKLVKL